MWHGREWEWNGRGRGGGRLAIPVRRQLKSEQVKVFQLNPIAGAAWLSICLRLPGVGDSSSAPRVSSRATMASNSGQSASQRLSHADRNESQTGIG